MNNLNNYNNFEDIDKINSQLERANMQKSILMHNIYREYEHYLNIVRDLLYLSVEKGVNELCNYPSIKYNLSNANDFFYLFEKKISELIYKNLPLLTVEQLKINKIKKNINKKKNFNSLVSSAGIKDDQIEKFQSVDGFKLEESFQYPTSEDICNTSEYYQADNHEKFASLDLDNDDHNNYLYKYNIFKI